MPPTNQQSSQTLLKMLPEPGTPLVPVGIISLKSSHAWNLRLRDRAGTHSCASLVEKREQEDEVACRGPQCLKGEGEIEKLQTKVLELQRKLDNTTAAVQELGRENQTLQIKHTQALNRKWAEDNEVQNCMACGKCFSVTVRRHHCRQCGNIFCAECSAKNALTPSSKKPVRVCDACFNDLQG
nr:early endosome antigen 1-like [Meriones unguiculatus]